MRAGWFAVVVACGSENDVIGPPVFDVVPTPVPEADVVRVEVWNQVANSVVDALFVVDDSASMEDEAAALVANFDSFLGWFEQSDFDWHVGVISTNMEVAAHKGKLIEARGLRWLDASTPDALGVFGEMVPLFDGVDHEESGRQAVFTALEIQGEDHNAGFLRPEGSLHVIVASDEDDHSPTPELGEFIDWFATFRPANRRSFSAVTVLTPCSDATEVGQDYIDVSTAVGGVLRSICEPDWVPVLDAVGSAAASPASEFFLAELPVDGSLDVVVTDVFGVELPLTFAYVGPRNSIVFDTAPPLGATVRAVYVVSAS